MFFRIDDTSTSITIEHGDRKCVLKLFIADYCCNVQEPKDRRLAIGLRSIWPSIKEELHKRGFRRAHILNVHKVWPMDFTMENARRHGL